MTAYPTTRPKGYASWKPREDTRRILDQVQDVLETYREYLPLTIRQIFYRLVGKYGYEKTELAYKRLIEYIGRARRARIIPFNAIRDDGWNETQETGWHDPDELVDLFIHLAQEYTRNKQAGQHYKVYLVAEAAGMVPQLARVADQYSVPVMSSGGFDSLTVKYDLARKAAQDKKTAVFLHVGDYDPSGVCIYDSLAADVKAFAAGGVSFERVALLPAHIAEYDLPTAPPKANDRRGNNVKQTCQLEALPPDILAELVEEAICQYYDLAVFEKDLVEEQEERQQLIHRLEYL